MLLEINAIPIYEELITADGARVISYSTAQRSSKFFSEGRMKIEDGPELWSFRIQNDHGK
jgi:hypothetical protein